MDNAKIKDTLKKGKQRGQSIFYSSEEIEFNVNDLEDSTFKKLLLHYDVTTGSPTEYLLTALLVALSGTIGKKAYYGPPKHKIYLNINAVIIGPSSYMRKTTAVKSVTFDIEQIQKTLHENYSREFEKWKEGEKKIDAPRKEYIRLPSDITPEKLAEILQTQQRGLIIFNEFAGWLKRLQGAHQIGAKELFTELYDNPESYSVARKTAEKDIHIETPVISIIGATTREWLLDALHESDQASGFLARFIISIRNRNDKDYTTISNIPDRIDKEPDFQTATIFQRLYELGETVLYRTKEAEKILDEYELQLKDEQDSAKLQDNENSFIERLKYYTHKFAGIIALVNERNTVQAEDAKDAVTIAGYFRENISQLITNELNQTKYSKHENKVFEWINKAGSEGIAKSNLLIKTRIPGKFLDDILKNLLEQDRIKFKTETTHKAKTIFFANKE
jgi:hypothetical protein